MQTMDDIIFESRDIEIFNIPDTKTKLNTLQNYFFPRLQRLLDVALLLIKEVYKIDPLERYTFVYRPSHRKDAKVNADYSEVYIGIGGRRNTKRQLKIKRPDGKAYSFHPSMLYFKVTPTGELSVELWPFSHQSPTYIREIKRYLIENYETFLVILNAGKISYEDGDSFVSIVSRLNDQHVFWLSSANHYFPIENQAAIHNLALSFAILFPVLDTCYDIAEGNTPIFTNHFDNLKTWLINIEDQEENEVEHNKTIPQIPELDRGAFQIVAG